MMPFCDSVLWDDLAGVHSVGSEINQFVYPSKSALQTREISTDLKMRQAWAMK
jgi:hypothetical protein